MTTTYGPSNDRISAAEWRLAAQQARSALHTARTNRLFERMTPPEQRVWLAQDVLKWLDTGKLTATKGQYLGVGEVATVATISPQVGKTVNGYECMACALGALMACAVERGGAGGTIRLYEGRDQLIWGSRIRAAMAPYFEPAQLVAIELAFERTRSVMETTVRDVLDWESQDRAVRFGTDVAYDAGETAGARDEAVMRAIMQNIIDNGGTFVP